MKVFATGDGLMLQLSQLEQQRVVAVAKPLKLTPRELLEAYAQTMTANFLQDINDVVLEFDDEEN
jgi:hypothetical protein